MTGSGLSIRVGSFIFTFVTARHSAIHFSKCLSMFTAISELNSRVQHYLSQVSPCMRIYARLGASIGIAATNQYDLQLLLLSFRPRATKIVLIDDNLQQC